jgi:hypothetical protein
MPSTSPPRAAAIIGRAHRASPTPLIYFHDARRLDYRGFFLPLGKFFRAFPIDIDACEFLAVRVIHSYLPVMVLAPFIMAHPTGFLWLGFFHFR